MLPVHLYGKELGSLTAETDGGVTFRAAGAAIARFGLGSVILSHSVPLRERRGDPGGATNFFGGLLPEGEALDHLAALARTGRGDIYGLLAHGGRDVAGAVTIGDTGITDARYEPIATDDIATRLDAAGQFPLGDLTGGSSLPGFQRKITLARIADQWLARSGSAASTHILKPAKPGDDGESAMHAEAYALALGRSEAFGVPLVAFESWVERFGSRLTLVIERYDRVIHPDGQVTRIHQEDAGQALGIDWGPYSKMERYEPKSNLRAVATILDVGRSRFSRAPSDKERLLRYVTFNVAIGNTDAHVKNFSVLHPESGPSLLAPLYDIAPHALGYDGNKTLAMRVAGVDQQPSVTREHLVAEAASWGISEERAVEVINATLDALLTAVDEVGPPATLPDHLPNYIRTQAVNLLTGKRAGIGGSLPPILMARIDTPEMPASR